MVVDASVWASAHILTDEFHTASRQWLQTQTASGVELVAPALLVVEVAGAVRRRIGSEAVARRTAEELIATPGLRLIPLDLPLAIEAATAASTLGVRGADAVYVAVARRVNLPLVTWDREIQERAAGFVRVIHP